MRDIKYCYRLHICAIPDLRDSPNSAGQTTWQVNLTLKFAIFWVGAGLQSSPATWFLYDSIKNAFYIGKKQSAGTCQSRLLCWFVWHVGVCVDKDGTKRIYLQAYGCQYLQLEQIQRAIYECTLSKNSLKSCWMQPVYLFMLLIRKMYSGLATYFIQILHVLNTSLVLNTSDELKDFLFFEVCMCKLD